ncbi:MAG: DUF1320 domain-containing protein [Paracoccus sp. (in: a-proteobacteria)]|uniref:gp436 family protein n=1 Tax=Paracoccus sp. TaxID=267 RepID=UPI0026E0037A|nr:DUF1320 domain-containing protein [Paracoccus sp. (in: a-proteobacteria)]MDO5614448.1 DUF1320 domain-containing protein [Paracoccus sp. (in: a-proteobacteria)]
MTYANIDDLIDRAGLQEMLDVADRDRDGVVDPTEVEAALIHADSIIDGYIMARYPTRFINPPPLLRTWATAIARYKLHRYDPPEYVETDYKDAIAALKDVARGLISLPLPDGAVAPDPSGQHQSWSPDQVFTPQNLQGWR